MNAKKHQPIEQNRIHWSGRSVYFSLAEAHIHAMAAIFILRIDS